MKKIQLQIVGMTCSACSSSLEKYLKKQKGIVEANVNLVLSIASITYENISIKTIENYIEKAGFKSEGEFKSIKEKENSKTEKRNLYGFGMLLILFFIINMTPMINVTIPYINVEHPKPYIIVIGSISFLFLFYGASILKNGLKNMIHKMPNMDSLIFFSVSFSFFYSLYAIVKIFLGDTTYLHHLYFESVCMVIYFVKLGRYLENKNKDKTKEAIKTLLEVTPKTAIKLEQEKKLEVNIDEIQKGDTLLVRPGEKIAVDGIVLKGETHVDESFITGESKPVLKEKGSKVIAGSINYEATLEYKAEKIGKESTISEIVTLVVEATNQKTKMQKMADKLSSYFVPFLFLFAFFVCGIQLINKQPLEEVILHFITIFSVACPCSIGLAVPLVVMVENNKCAKKGLFIRNSEILEIAKNTDTIVLDKTGTLTYGKLKIHKCFNYLSIKEKDLLNLVANIESFSTHPIKNAFTIHKKLPVENFKNYEGMGISGEVLNNTYYLGNEKLVNKLKIKEKKKEDYESLVKQGCSIIYVIENNHVIGLIGIKDTIRKEVKEVINELKKQKIEIIMLSGDNKTTAEIIANELGIAKIVADTLPKEKGEFIENLLKEKRKVIMVGDGLNDAPALVKATIGISINDGTDVAHNASNVILMNNNLQNTLDLINISKEAVRVMKQNLFWAFLYNMIMLPIAVGFISPFGIKMNPLLASIAMMLSSLTVVCNALRVNKEG